MTTHPWKIPRRPLGAAVRCLSTLGISLLLLAAANTPAPHLEWLVYIDVVQAPPTKMCVDDTASVYVILSYQPDKPSAPPLVPMAGTYSVTASLGTVSRPSGTWHGIGHGLRFEYEASKPGKEVITVTATIASEVTAFASFPITVETCQYDLTLSAHNEKKTAEWWWLTTFEGKGSITTGESGALSGSGTYSFRIDGLWKSQTDALKCVITKPFEGSSSFEISGSSIPNFLLVTLNFAQASVPTAKTQCIDKEGKPTEELPVGFDSQWNPAQDVTLADMLFSKQGSEWPFTFGDGGEGTVSVVARRAR